MRLKPAFLALVSVQALHSAEEYAFRLYEVFPPARLVSGLISGDLRRGFLVFNAALVAFGFWCYLFPVRRNWPSAAAFAWLWVAIELVNGIGHPAWSVIQRGYTPGVVTALVLLPLALLVARRLGAGQT
ncbi:MAG TPA: HXXEE domain-containing protein [Longimicrobium sp.]|nr:HXXEE domain-containing protein [Longimicrobium sp.]